MNLTDIQNIEGDAPSTDAYYASLQRCINAGSWSLQGSYGRAMNEAIESGNCLLGRHRCRDFYGNVIPSRTDVQPGTKGSFDYVVEQMGEDWAKAMEAV